jgi:hypothetical protein
MYSDFGFFLWRQGAIHAWAHAVNVKPLGEHLFTTRIQKNMSSVDYSLELGGPKRLTLIWAGSSLSILFDDKEIADVSATTEALLKGHQITLPDNSVLSVQIVKQFLFPQLHINRDGVPIPNSPSDPRKKIKSASVATFILGGLHILTGLALYSFVSSMISAVIIGALFIILGFVIRRESLWALAAVVIMQLYFNTIPTILNMNTIFAAGGLPSVISFFFRLYLLAQLIIGINAAWSIKGENKKRLIK